MKPQIQLLFPEPGKWDKLALTAIFTGEDGFVQYRRYTQDDIPADQAPALEAAVTAIASMGEDWQAAQVWARLGSVTTLAPDEPFEPYEHEVEAVELTVEAVNPQGGRRIFTAADYPEFKLTRIAALAFFKHFTKQ